MNGQAQFWQAEPQGSSYGNAASSHNKALSMHRWANWIAGFSGEFANSAIVQFLPGEIGQNNGRSGVVLDPFAGVGTTLVEANRLGLDCIGFEINPFAALVCRVKLGAADVCLDDLQDAVKGYDSFMAGRRWAAAGKLAARRVQEPHSLLLARGGAQGLIDSRLYEQFAAAD